MDMMQISDVLFSVRTSIEPTVFVEGYDKAPKITELSDYSINSIVNDVGENIVYRLTRMFMDHLGDVKDSMFTFKYCTGHTQQRILDKITESYDNILQAIQHIDLVTPAIIVGGMILLGTYLLKR